MAKLHGEERLGEAWGLHRSERHAEAIKIYEDILNTSPEHIDALYGLGLAKRAEGDLDGAAAAFEKALANAKTGLESVEQASAVEGHHGGNDLDSDEDDRFMMLIRMISQRLDEVKAAQ